MTVCHVDDGDFSPVKHKVSNACTEDDGHANVEVERHEGKHQRIRKEHLNDVKKRLNRMRKRQDAEVKVTFAHIKRRSIGRTRTLPLSTSVRVQAWRRHVMVMESSQDWHLLLDGEGKTLEQVLTIAFDAFIQDRQQQEGQAGEHNVPRRVKDPGLEEDRVAKVKVEEGLHRRVRGVLADRRKGRRDDVLLQRRPLQQRTQGRGDGQQSRRRSAGRPERQVRVMLGVMVQGMQ